MVKSMLAHYDQSVHKMLPVWSHYANENWCIAQIAEISGSEKTATTYYRRSENYRNVYDPEIGFMRPKLTDGRWKPGFNPMDTHGQGFIEGNAWNYGLYVPHKPDEMIEMMGGGEIVFYLSDKP